MKKFLTILTWTICLVTFAVTHAASPAPNPDAKTIAIVIISGVAYKNDSVYDGLKKVFNSEKNTDLVIETGDAVQSKYTDFWARKGFLSEQPPTEESMIEFVITSGYDRVVYLIPGDFSVTREIRHSGNFLGQIFPQLDNSSFSYNTTGKVFGVICDRDKLLNKAEAEWNSDSGSGSVFSYCATKIAKSFSADI